MIDQSSINLLNLVAGDTNLKRRNRDEHHGACPFCGKGEDRFWVNTARQRWYCRQCNIQGGDAVSYVQRRENVDFKTAVSMLGLSDGGMQNLPKRSKPRPRPANAPHNMDFDKPAIDDPAWQDNAQEFVLNCRQALWSDDGVKALDYLRGRGLADWVIDTACLGVHNGEHSASWGETPVKIYHSIVIPNILNRRVMAIKMRPADGRPDKYVQVKGGASQTLYRPFGYIRPHVTAVLVESELDALSLLSGGGGNMPIVAIATGGSEHCRKLLWLNAVGVCNRVLLAFDDDEAGEHASSWWASQLGSKALRLKPTRHDVNDMLTAGEDIPAWIEPHLPPPEFVSLPKNWRFENQIGGAA